ncbi:hypothetical protein LXA43DRAFT_895032 [Ganoderma leucocontextum]|nr:hypothetical protein LXA43DRAFT_895032 [Ganoderma leucocontextum]
MQCCIQKWARCRLPNGQICRSAWKEIANNMTRIARNVKLSHHPNSERFEYAEIQYYFQCPLADETRTLAVVSKYGPPNEELLRESSGVVWACCKLETNGALAVIDVKSIQACVAMVPSELPHPDASEPGCVVYFAVDKIGVDIGHLGDMDEPDGDIEDGGAAEGAAGDGIE